MVQRPSRHVPAMSVLNPHRHTLIGLACPLWVKSRHCLMFGACPLYPQKRTSAAQVVMSAKCQERTFERPRRHIQVEVLLPTIRSSRRASVLLSPLRPRSAHIVSFWPVRDEYGHEHSLNQSRPRTVARPIFSFEPHVETLTLSMSDLTCHSPAVSLLFNAYMASDTHS